MKVAVKYTVTVTEEDRRAMRAYYGREGLATREKYLGPVSRSYEFELTKDGARALGVSDGGYPEWEEAPDA